MISLKETKIIIVFKFNIYQKMGIVTIPCPWYYMSLQENPTTLSIAYCSCVEIIFAEFDLKRNHVDLTYT